MVLKVTTKNEGNSKFFQLIYIYIYTYIKPLKSEAIHETGLSGNVVTSFFPLIIFIYIHIYIVGIIDIGTELEKI